MTRPDPRDVDGEIEFHIEETVEALVASGMDPRRARETAERRFGDRSRYADAMRSAHVEQRSTLQRFSACWTDIIVEVRLAARSLSHAPGYAITVIATLALASGANLTVFGIMDGLTYRPLRYLQAPDDVHRVYWQWSANGQRTTSGSTQYTRFVDLERESRALSDVAAFAERNLPVGEGEAAQQRPVAAVSASYFRFFDARPVRGRFFSEAEDVTPRGADVAVLGYAYWHAAFGGRDVVGQILRVGEIRATIVGIAPEGFDGLNDGRPPAVFVPTTTYAASTGTSDAQTYFSAYKWGWVHLLVRRSKGIDADAASAEVTRIFRETWPRFMADNPNIPSADGAEPRALLSPLRPGAGPTAGPVTRTAIWLFALACVVLLIGCANVAHLSVSRSLARRRDVAVRIALGISTRRLLAGTCAEATLLALVSGIAALAVAQSTRTALSPLLRALYLPDLSVFSDRRTLLVTALVVIFSATVMAVLPCLLLRRSVLTDISGRSRGATPDGGRARLVLLTTQAMLSVTLLVGAGLFVHSLLAVQSSPLGYDPRHVLVVNRQIPPGGFDAAQQSVIREQLLEAAVALPNVESAAWVSSTPFLSTSSTDIHVPGVPDAAALGPFTFQATTAGYFRTMGTRILRGRGLLPNDSAGSPAVSVVSESMARTLWPGRDAIGQCFHMRTVDSPCREVVGIAEDIVQQDLADGPRRHYYVPIEQYPRTFGNGMLMKLHDESPRAAETVRATLQRGLPAGYYLVAQRLSDVVVDRQASWRLGAAVLVSFAALALIVAGVGLFGSVRYDIAQRSREWAVRLALGAGRPAIMHLIIRRSLIPVIAGVLPGLLIALVLGPWVQPLLYRTSARDPLLYCAAASLLVVVAIVASTWPALHAARVDPNAVLRNE